MLVRGIRKWDLVLLVINSIIGAGIFGVPSKIFALSGSYSLWAFIVCALISMTFSLCFAEVSSRFDKTGGPYIYALSAFGRFPAFLVGWLLLIGRIFGYAAVINLLVVYLSYFWPIFNEQIVRAACILFITGLLAYVNHIGIKNSTRFNNFLTIGKLTPLALFIIIGLFNMQSGPFKVGGVPSFSSFSDSILILFFVFGGYEVVLINSGEIDNPKKSLPFALILATIIVTVFYCLIIIVCIGTLPTLATSEQPLAEAAAQFMGWPGAAIIGLGAVISIIGNLNANMLGNSRIPFALSTEHQFPRIFCEIHHKYLTPTWSLFSVAAIVAVVSLLWSFLGALTIVSITRIIVFCMVCAALIKFRLRKIQESHFHLRYAYFLAILSFIFSAWILSSLDLTEIRDVSIFILMGIIIYGINKKFQVGKKTSNLIKQKIDK